MGYKVTLGEVEFMDTVATAVGCLDIDVRAAKSTEESVNPVHIFLQLLLFNTELMDLTVDIPIFLLRSLCLSLFLRPIPELDFLELQ